MAKVKRMSKGRDKSVYRATAVRTRRINRSGANAHGGIRL